MLVCVSRQDLQDLQDPERLTVGSAVLWVSGCFSRLSVGYSGGDEGEYVQEGMFSGTYRLVVHLLLIGANNKQQLQDLC